MSQVDNKKLKNKEKYERYMKTENGLKKRAEAMYRYNQSEKGLEARRRYNITEHAKELTAARQRAFRERKALEKKISNVVESINELEIFDGVLDEIKRLDIRTDLDPNFVAEE